MPLRQITCDELARYRLTTPNLEQSCQKWIFLPGRGLVFTITPALRANIGWICPSSTDHRVSGDGSDDIGQFVITGRFDETNGECYWTKAYMAGHDVYYRGFREGKGIWGLWELPNESGGFHIWPLGQGKANRIMRAQKSPRQ